ncbi:hypothetical protein ACFC26_07850 [Kitasatospora purpeofusca]|uniref:hypothetical protein n=1 Tax=Kitasatospora purpeofusca TaxID=67352 RepID=UPI0035DB0265
MVTFAEYLAEQARNDRTALKCLRCYRRRPRLEFRETPWHGRAASCRYCEGFSADARAEVEARWWLAQEQERVRGLRRGLEAVRKQRAVQGMLLRHLGTLASALDWSTSCLSCARVLDSSVQETVRADRYRSAWLSARRRASSWQRLYRALLAEREHRLGTGPWVTLRGHQAAMRRAAKRHAADDARARAFVAELDMYHDWTFVGEPNQYRDRLRLMFASLIEYNSAVRNGRRFISADQRPV